MGIIRRLADAFRPAAEAETRDSWTALPSFSMGGGTVAGRDAIAAEGLATVTAAINAISSSISTLPACVMQSTPGGKVEAPNHPVQRLIRNGPNARQSFQDWLEMMLGSVLLHGNALSEIVWDGAGRPVALNPIPWPSVNPMVINGTDLAFDVVQYSGSFGSGMPRRILAADAWFLMDRSDNGWLGRSRISRAPEVIAAATGLATFSSAIWRNAATPSGLLTFNPATTIEGRKRQAAHLLNYNTGAENAGKLMLMEGDSKYTPFSMSPEDAEVLASRQFSVVEICRLFGVPPPILQAYEFNTFTNAQQAETWYATRCLMPWITKIEASFARSLFSDPSFNLSIDMSSLVRGDYTAQITAGVAAVAAGALTVDELREQIGYGPMPAGMGAAPAGPPPATE